MKRTIISCDRCKCDKDSRPGANVQRIEINLVIGGGQPIFTRFDLCIDCRTELRTFFANFRQTVIGWLQGEIA